MTWRKWLPAAGAGVVTGGAAAGWLQSPELVAWFAATVASGLATFAWLDHARGEKALGAWSTWRLVVAAASGVSVLIALGQWRVVGASGPEAALPGVLHLLALAISRWIFPQPARD